MVRVKSESEIKKNYEDSTALVPARYEAGVRSATWQAAAIEGQDLYEEQMRKDEVLKRRASGIQRTSDEEWRSNAVIKGKPNIGTRMKAASGKQVEGFRPYREALVGLDLPGKTADPMTNLMNRAGAVVQKLVDTKRQISG